MADLDNIIDKKAIGDYGERQAADYLSAHGFTILHRNWRYGRYELDIVARRADTVHFVEVKCRKAGSLTSPEQAATNRKFGSLCRAAEAYIEEFGIEDEVSFDLVAVEYRGQDCEIRYIPNAMTNAW